MDVFFQKLFLPVLLRYGRVDLMRGYVKPLRTEQRAPICVSPGFFLSAEAANESFWVEPETRFGLNII